MEYECNCSDKQCGVSVCIKHFKDWKSFDYMPPT